MWRRIEGTIPPPAHTMANNELSIQPSALSIFVAIFVAVIVVDRYYRWLTHNSIKHIRGPAVSSALLGVLHWRDLLVWC